MTLSSRAQGGNLGGAKLPRGARDDSACGGTILRGMRMPCLIAGAPMTVLPRWIGLAAPLLRNGSDRNGDFDCHLLTTALGKRSVSTASRGTHRPEGRGTRDLPEGEGLKRDGPRASAAGIDKQ